MQNDNNGPLTPVQISLKDPDAPGSADETTLIPHGKKGGEVTLSKAGQEEEISLGSISISVPKSPEWTDVPIKIIPPIKTSVSLTEDAKKRSEEGKDIGSVLSCQSQSSGGDNEWLQTSAEQEFASQESFVRESDAEVPLDEIKKHPVGHVSVEEASSQELDTESMHVAPNTSEEELPKLPPVRLRSAESKVPEAPKETISGGIRKNGEALTPVNVAPAVESTTFGLGSYLDVPVGQDISSSGKRHITTCGY